MAGSARTHRSLAWWLAPLAALALAATASGQSFEVRPVPLADGGAAVYHTADVGLDESVLLERSVAGGPFESVTPEPVRLPADEASAAAAFGDDLDPILEQTGHASAFVALIALASDPVEAASQSAVSSGAARALARVIVDAAAPAGQQATYRVTILDGRGDPTARQSEATVTLTPSLPPPPGGLSASHEGLRVMAAWIAARDERVVGYRVFDGETELTSRLILHNTARSPDSVFTSFRVPAPGPVRLTVRSVDIVGQLGPPSGELSYTITDNVAPRFVDGVAAFASPDGAIDVTWPLSPEPDLAGYHVYRASGTGDDDEPVRLTDTLLPAATTAYRDEVVAGRGARSWFYRVQAVDAAGNASPLSNAAMAQVEDRVAPLAPSALAAQFDGRGVALTWEAEVSDDLATFVVERRQLTAGAAPTRSPVTVDTLRTTSVRDLGPADLGFQEGEIYRYYVAAQDSARNTSRADSVEIRIPNVTPPEPPGSVAAVSHQGHRVRVTWAGSASTDVVGYRISRDGGTPADVAGTEYRDSDVVPGTRYAYSVVSVDAAGNESTPSRAEVVFRDATPPPGVRNARARLGEGGVTVTWEPSPAPDVTTYRVERAAIVTGTYEPLATVEGTTWTHASGTQGAWYRVVAVDTSGLEAAPSEPARALDLR